MRKGVVRVAMAILTTVAGGVLAMTGSDAAYGSCPFTPNMYAHNYSGRVGFHGIYANMNTYNPAVPDIHAIFSNSHVYLQSAGGFVETG
jgi:hypothetical protein